MPVYPGWVYHQWLKDVQQSLVLTPLNITVNRVINSFLFAFPLTLITDQPKPTDRQIASKQNTKRRKETTDHTQNKSYVFSGLHKIFFAKIQPITKMNHHRPNVSLITI